MNITSKADGMQMDDTASNNAPRVNLLPKQATLYLAGFIWALSLTFCSVSQTFAAGSMQGAFIDAGNKQDANRAFVKDVTERVLLPTFETFSMQSKHLSQTTETFCNTGRTAEQFAQLKSSWSTTKQTWAQTLPFRFGPALDNFLDLKIQFWPDDKNLVRKMTRNFLNANQSPNTEELAKAPSPAQGLSVMEYLIFDSEEGGFSTFTDGNSANQRCDYLKAAAKNLSKQAQDLLKAWGNSSHGYLAEFSYSNKQEVIDESFSVILRESLVAIEIIKNLKVGKPFGLRLPNAKVNAYFLESWRSQNSQENIISSLITFQQVYYGGSRFGLDDLLINNYNETELEFGLRTQITKCLELATALPKPLFNQMNNSATQAKGKELHTELIKLIAIIKQNLSQTLGVTIGFSSNDGD